MPPDACLESPPDGLIQGIEEFNQGRFYECHETLEDLWMAEPRDIRQLYQGILQIGVAFHHLRAGRYQPVVTLLQRGSEYLRPFAPSCMRVDVEHLLEVIAPFASALVISGKGELPDSLRQNRRVDDLPGLQGPLAGIGALVRDEPFSSRLILACDLPYMNSASVQWLLDQRQPRYVAVIPENPVTGRSEPLFGWYDYRCGPLIEDLIKSGSRRIREICASQLVLQPRIPAHLAGGWRNINRPEDL